MINALGVLGWGVGGIEAEAVMLGQPHVPDAAGRAGSAAVWRARGRCDRHRPGADDHRDAPAARRGGKLRRVLRAGRALADPGRPGDHLQHVTRVRIDLGDVPDRRETLGYLRETGRPPELVDLVERYTKEQGLYRTGDEGEVTFSDTLDFDLARSSPAWPGRAGRKTACRWVASRPASMMPSEVTATAASWATARWPSPPSRAAPTRRTPR